ncbi:hypothetical protein GCM10027275_54450 [Rhabdobacter roseus]|uniref:BT4734-like N-terminal domain-containing protein n=1 Tax=Rhabdobacter roseus TaxID=1655419 RepID=A0A840U6L4_9BACT|nr:CRISPR-associated primase-polymerase type B [Rhabdobacter roseus]MBB5287459.1 hypothetical protein [Rhabdobacter roseus]
MCPLPPLSYGTQLAASPPEPLQTWPLPKLVGCIRHDADLARRIGELRRLRTLDPASYRPLKTTLPYVAGGVFEDGLRRKEAFREAPYWILDLDDCLTTPAASAALRQKLCDLPGVVLLYTSPGGLGLKAFFRLEPACPNALAFSEAYRQFASSLADRLALVGSVDLRTHDVARACFLSHDPDAYFNPDAEPLPWQAYLLPSEPAQPQALPPKAKEPDADTYLAIRQLVNPHATVRPRERQVHIPALLLAAEASLRAAIEAQPLELTRVLPLNYGLKFVVKRGFAQAEVNVFYGKRGFSVVPSPKSGTSAVLMAELLALVSEVLLTPPTPDAPL